MTRETRPAWWLANTVLLAIGVGCGTAPSDTSQSTASPYRWSLARDAGHDAAEDAGAPTDDASTAATDDAGSATDDAAPSSAPPAAGSVACYTDGDPTATCAAPAHCCFTNYNALHEGYCTTDDCPYGTLSCDGPEDCAAGNVCCARALSDPDFGTYGYVIACQSTCGDTPLVHELCHATDTSPSGTCADPTAACVTAHGNDNDLPAVLSICQ